MSSLALLANQAGGANGASIELKQGARGDFGAIVRGTLGTSLVKVQVSDDNATWADHTTVAVGHTALTIRAPYVRGVITAGTGAGLYLTLFRT
jgi:hypothetical protein